MKQSAKKNKLNRIKLLMAASYLLLIGFVLQWMYTQYRQEENTLQKELAKLFENVQQNITDSLLLVSLINPAFEEAKEAPAFKMQNGTVVALNEDSIKELSNILLKSQHQDLSLQGLKMAVRKVRNLTPGEKQVLFQIDTTIFNSEYADRMKRMGWNFPVKWVASGEGKLEGEHIYISNNYLHAGFGVVITEYRGYLMGKLWMQGAFIMVLLSAILIAFRTTYTSLSRQIQLSEMKDDFVSNISHELKTPIATVKVAIEAIQHFEAAGETSLTAEYMHMASLEIERLELLVNRSLHTSLLESGKLSLQPELHNLKTIIEEVLLAYQVKFISYEADATFTTAGSNFDAMVDKLHLQGVLVNLLDNSLKYATSKPIIEVSLMESDNALSISVKDNGPGIPDAYRHKVFEKFFRVPSGNEHNVKGYGLGLSYAAQVMQQHKGSIAVNNVPEGGCNFTLSLQ